MNEYAYESHGDEIEGSLILSNRSSSQKQSDSQLSGRMQKSLKGKLGRKQSKGF